MAGSGRSGVTATRPGRLHWSPPATAALLFAVLAPWPSESASYCTPEVLARYQSDWPAALDWGIYWFGSGDATLKAVDGEKSVFYDPVRPTLIFFPGWHKGTNKCKRLTTRCSDLCPGGGGQLLAERWLQAGWNVGYFYWDQFADEDCPRTAEQKIWFDRKGNGLRWRSYSVATDSSVYLQYKDAFSVTDMCVQAVHKALGKFSGPRVRFVGHDIGAQLAVRCAGLLHKEGHVAAPQRLALLEPFFTTHRVDLFFCQKLKTSSGLGSFTAKATTAYVRTLWDRNRVVTEVYKSSVMTEMDQFGDPNDGLERITALVKYDAVWCGGLGFLKTSNFGNVKCKHNAVIPTYFLNYGLPPPQLVAGSVLPTSYAQLGSAMRACITPSPTCTDGQLREWIERQMLLNGTQQWEQRSGRATFNVSDDTFRLTPDLSAASQVVVLQAVSFADSDTQALHDYLWELAVGPKGCTVAVVLALLVFASIGTCAWRRSSCKAGGDTSESEEDVADASPRSQVPMVRKDRHSRS